MTGRMPAGMPTQIAEAQDALDALIADLGATRGGESQSQRACPAAAGSLALAHRRGGDAPGPRPARRGRHSLRAFVRPRLQPGTSQRAQLAVVQDSGEATHLWSCF